MSLKNRIDYNKNSFTKEILYNRDWTCILKNNCESTYKMLYAAKRINSWKYKAIKIN